MPADPKLMKTFKKLFSNHPEILPKLKFKMENIDYISFLYYFNSLL